MKRQNLFTMVELLIVFSIVLILISLLQPAMHRIVGGAQTAQCLALQKNIHMCAKLFAQDNNDQIVRVGRRGASGAGAIIPNNNFTFWPDILEDYVETLNNVTCASVPGKFGIGLNHPELGSWLSVRFKFDMVRNPSKTVLFADSALISNASEADPDLWQTEETDRSSFLFRTPNNVPWFNIMPTRVYNRHLKMTNVMNVDGHGETVFASEIGFQYPRNHKLAYWDR